MRRVLVAALIALAAGASAAAAQGTPARITIVSNLTGEFAAADELCAPEYWVQHVRRTVRFEDGVRCLRPRCGDVVRNETEERERDNAHEQDAATCAMYHDRIRPKSETRRRLA